MIDFTNARISALIVHFVGNKGANEGVVVSDEETEISDERTNLKLVDFFTKSFAKREDFYRFTHATDMNLNASLTFADAIFTDNKKFGSNSRKFAKHLYECSDHPKINPGELIVIFFEGLVYQNAPCTALGLYKSESKNTVLKVLVRNENYSIKPDSGITTGNIEKACLILNTEQDDGYRMLINSTQANSEDSVFWKDDFLHVDACADSYHHTSTYLKLAKSFIDERVAEDDSFSKADRANMLSKSAEYFKVNEKFNVNEFAEEVFEQRHTAKSFLNYKEEMRDTPEYNMLDADGFEISDAAVKRNAKHFKSVLKLDKNFHLYIHGDRNMIEKGYDDERNLNYYKVFFKEEK